MAVITDSLTKFAGSLSGAAIVGIDTDSHTRLVSHSTDAMGNKRHPDPVQWFNV